MRITETARNNHEELFPHRTSTLLVTDPELIEVFDNFAFDEVLGVWKSGYQNTVDGHSGLPDCQPGLD